MDNDLKWLFAVVAVVSAAICLSTVTNILTTSEKEACIKASIEAHLSNEQLVTLCSGAK